jgi:hypothetical protein
MSVAIRLRMFFPTRDRRFQRYCAFTLLVMCALLNTPASFAQEQPKHTISVTFDYDFTAMHACSKTVTKKCVVQFNVYDISGPKRYFLFSIPAPAGASGHVKGISGTSPPLLFEPGKHLLGIAAKTDNGDESSPSACSVWTRIPQPEAGSAPAVNSKPPS